MTRRSAGAGLLAGLGFLVAARGQPKAKMTKQASGTFDVKLTPQGAADAVVGRMSIAKTFHGTLDGTSVGEMLAFMAAEKSAGYVAMEKVSGTLDGRKGTFTLQHSGTMTRGAGTLSVTVVPDSGTDELLGLSGKMGIEITGGKHFYTFDYEIAASK